MEQPTDKDKKVEQIREAAKDLFLRHGFARVSTTVLAVEAGVSKETLYSRYPSKEAILADVLQHLITADTAPAGGERPHLETMSGLDRALRVAARELSTDLMQRDYIELARIVIAETPRMPHIGEIFRQSVPQRAFQHIGELLGSARDAKLIRDVDLGAAAQMFVGPVVLHALINVLLVAPESDEAQRGAPPFDVDPHVDLFLAAVTAGKPVAKAKARR